MKQIIVHCQFISQYIKLEAVIWLIGLAYLALIDPHSSTHLSFCPLHNLGFDFCPGCGLGRSISLILHGDVTVSLAAHPLGIPALLILCYRIAVIIRRSIIANKITLLNHAGGHHG